MDTSTDKITGFHVFVYGTLRTDQPESEIFKKHLISSVPARIRGKLYLLPEGYPVLEVNPSQIVATATSNPFSDWASAIKPGKPPIASTNETLDWIEGELLTLELDQNAFNEMDAWEGFRAERNSLYQRVITQATNEQGKEIACWCYVCIQAPQPPLRPIDVKRWERPSYL